mgnify:CR=1 FL=1
MGSLRWGRVLVSTVLLVLAGLAVLFRQESAPRPVAVSLSSALTSFGVWQTIGDIPLDERVRSELKLDDYLFRRFSDGQATLVLYVGYYYSKAKVGAAHDPLVCFPGQGWVLSDKKTITSQAQFEGVDTPAFTTMKAERNENKELLLYWFQADAQATASTLMQKLHLLRAKILGQGQHNAFVRVSINVRDANMTDGQEALNRFVSDFYPVFLAYVQRVGSTVSGDQSL